MVMRAGYSSVKVRCCSVSKDRTNLFINQHFQVTEDTGRKLLEWLISAPPPEPVQEQLAKALADIDPETLSAYLIARGAAADGLVASVSDAYAEKALGALPRLLEAIEKFRLETSSNGDAELATNIPAGIADTER